jgi:hypothetical protein
MVVSVAKEETSRYDNSLLTFLSTNHSCEWWMDTRANIHVYPNATLFLLTRLSGLEPS